MYEDYEMLITENHLTQHISPDSSMECIEISSEEENDFIPKQISPDRLQHGRNMLKQLNTTLSPKFTTIEASDGRVSRYGRHQKAKSLDDGFIPTELARFVSKSGAKALKPVTFDVLRIIKTPTKIYPEEGIVDNNNESPEKALDEKMPEADLAMDDLELLENQVGQSETEPMVVEETNPSERADEEASSVSQLEIMDEQLWDVDSGRGSSIDTEVAALIATYQEGEIYWVQYNSMHEWWPCLIAADPDGVLMRNNIKLKCHEIHVKYFADKRAWIPHHKLVPYKSLDELMKSHEVSLKKHKKLFPRAVALASTYVNIPIEQRIARFEADVENERKQRLEKRRRSKDTVPAMLNRSLTPESPAYEDLTVDREAVKSDFDFARELALRKRKRTISMNTSASETSSKRVRYSRRSIELKSKPVPAPPISRNTSMPIKVKIENKSPVENLEMQGLSIEERLRKEFMTNEFNHTHLYPENPIKKEHVCRLCYHPKNLIKCGGCNGHFHEECVSKLNHGQQIPTLQRGPTGRYKGKKGKSKNRLSMSRISVESVKTEILEEITETLAVPEDSGPKPDFVCYHCSTKTHQTCFICKVKAEDDTTVQCSYKGCLRYYHKACFAEYPQASVNIDDTFICPYHKCHTCFASDAASVATESKLVTCVFCPTSYHYNDVNCIPAGTEWLTTIQIICPNHALHPPSNINVNWCFVCSRGGDLICCETCPGAFHLSCVNETEAPQGKYVCDTCKAGRRPLYNELVWAKMGNYRFWPAIILPPMVVPLEMLDTFHYPNDFCVKFFGSKDCAWLASDRVFSYEEEDYMSRSSHGTRDSLNAAFKVALSEVKIVHNMLESEKTESQRTTHAKGKPDPYVKIKTNRPVPPVKLEMDIEAAEMINFECSCKPTDADPCGYSSQCWNRSLNQECNAATCPAKDKCQNQAFMKKLYPKLKERNTFNKGWGLFAEEDIQQDTFVIEYVGELINVEEMNRRMALRRARKQDNYYFMGLKNGHIIDAGEKGNLARFINHSCMPNCTTEIWQVGRTVRVGIFALRDIHKEEELSFDYQLECKGDVQKACNCGTEECRGYIGPRKREDRRSSINSVRSSTTKSKIGNPKPTKKRKNSKVDVRRQKKQKLDPTQVSQNESMVMSTSITIEDDLEVKSENFVPASPDNTVKIEVQDDMTP